MKINKIKNSIRAGLLLLLAGVTGCSALYSSREEFNKNSEDFGVTAGIDLGYKSPQTLKISYPLWLPSGDMQFQEQGVGFSYPVIRTLPAVKSINAKLKSSGPISPFIGLKNPDIKIGYIFEQDNLERELWSSVDYNLQWGIWPLGGIDLYIKKRNLGFVDLGIFSFDEEDSLVDVKKEFFISARLDEYSMKWNLWNSRYPYGSEWGYSREQLYLSNKTVAEDKAKILTIGPKYNSYFGNYYIFVSLGGSFKVGKSDSKISPSISGTVGLGLKF